MPYVTSEEMLMTAVVRGQLPLVKILLRGGVDPNHQLSDGRTALMFACSIYKTDRKKSYEDRLFQIVRHLLKFGANINLLDNKGRSCFMYACNNGYSIQFIEELINSGADVNLKDNFGNTSIDYAEEEINSDIVDALLNSQRKKIYSQPNTRNHSKTKKIKSEKDSRGKPFLKNFSARTVAMKEGTTKSNNNGNIQSGDIDSVQSNASMYYTTSCPANKSPVSPSGLSLVFGTKFDFENIYDTIHEEERELRSNSRNVDSPSNVLDDTLAKTSTCYKDTEVEEDDMSPMTEDKENKPDKKQDKESISACLTKTKHDEIKIQQKKEPNCRDANETSNERACSKEYCVKESRENAVGQRKNISNRVFSNEPEICFIHDAHSPKKLLNRRPSCLPPNISDSANQKYMDIKETSNYLSNRAMYSKTPVSGTGGSESKKEDSYLHRYKEYRRNTVPEQIFVSPDYRTQIDKEKRRGTFPTLPNLPNRKSPIYGYHRNANVATEYDSGSSPSPTAGISGFNIDKRKDKSSTLSRLPNEKLRKFDHHGEKNVAPEYDSVPSTNNVANDFDKEKRRDTFLALPKLSDKRNTICGYHDNMIVLSEYNSDSLAKNDIIDFEERRDTFRTSSKLPYIRNPIYGYHGNGT